ncbi:septal ring lytic transglycosylase RlpA family protein [Zhongshania aquimaris]|uniref:Endolytic peptidoglycan transglycosylase RlpA n=1 Tax=Zhongshania aquimaris TaxID=2857107 RepID=A0ABS6VNQ8_9GAMM|nr:septal ring lytic transglycosylase RlpA family protein [Zhongshania aquimaris]MBW2939939.1 septal ring lytic transglycosylase RlpA family protein [Zhongshania aquimaris]
MKVELKYLAIALLGLVIAACSNLPKDTASADSGPLDGRERLSPDSGSESTAYTETGRASFYADKFQLRRTANGEFYKHELNTAAHKTLPFGKIVKVSNVANGKSVIVRINDRGPFIRGRIIDLSKSAFSSIGNLASGIIKVEIEVIE